MGIATALNLPPTSDDVRQRYSRTSVQQYQQKVIFDFKDLESKNISQMDYNGLQRILYILWIL